MLLGQIILSLKRAFFKEKKIWSHLQSSIDNQPDGNLVRRSERSPALHLQAPLQHQSGHLEFFLAEWPVDARAGSSHLLGSPISTRLRTSKR